MPFRYRLARRPAKVRRIRHAAYSAMAQLGAPLTPAEMGIAQRRLTLSMHRAKDYHSRYALFKLVDECGLLERYLADYPLLP